MSHIFVQSERIIEASPEEVFVILADYKNKRPRMLTPRFLNYTVEQGGEGSGTVIRYRFRAGKRERDCRMIVDETKKGELLTERDSNSSLVTRWSVHPLDGGRRSKVTVESEWEGASGIGGFFERTFAPPGLGGVYKDMLYALAQLTQSPGRTQTIMKIDRKSIPTSTSMAMLALGSVVAVVASINYLRHRQRV